MGDYLFGLTACAVIVQHDPLVGRSDTPYVARVYRIEDNGRAVRELANREGHVVVHSAATSDAVLQSACEYLERRFGPRGALAEGLKPRHQRTIETPPLAGETD